MLPMALVDLGALGFLCLIIHDAKQRFVVVQAALSVVVDEMREFTAHDYSSLSKCASVSISTAKWQMTCEL